MSGFTWIPFYKELAEKLLEDELIEFIFSEEGLKEFSGYLYLKSKTQHIKDIDPFTLYGIFNRRITDENRKKILEKIKTFFKIKETVPTDFWGIPILIYTRLKYFSLFDNWVEDERLIQICDNLWNIFEKVVINNISQEEIVNLVKTSGIGFAMATMPLFWINPDKYMPMDKNSIDYLEAQKIIDEKEIKPENYFKLLDIIKNKFNSGELKEKSFVELSQNAWKSMKKQVRKFWAVGYAWESTGDQRERFFKESIWEEGYLSNGDARFKTILEKVAIGDILLLKSKANHNHTYIINNNNCIISIYSTSLYSHISL